MKIQFAKMQGLGNDFVVIDTIRQAIQLTTAQIQHLADRRFGVGCDQVLLVAPAEQTVADFSYQIFNADGSSSSQCGNGARCFMLFLHATGLTSKTEVTVATSSGLLTLLKLPNGLFKVNMGIPEFRPEHIPFLAETAAANYELAVGKDTIRIGAVSMGNPHAVLAVADVDAAPVTTLGAKIESHARFPQRVNVGFAQRLSDQHIRLRVYERGVGETLACGSGACAAVAVGRQQGLLKDAVTVSLPGGDLFISWSGNDQPLWMTGAAAWVFAGEIEL